MPDKIYKKLPSVYTVEQDLPITVQPSSNSTTPTSRPVYEPTTYPIPAPSSSCLTFCFKQQQNKTTEEEVNFLGESHKFDNVDL